MKANMFKNFLVLIAFTIFGSVYPAFSDELKVFTQLETPHETDYFIVRRGEGNEPIEFLDYDTVLSLGLANGRTVEIWRSDRNGTGGRKYIGELLLAAAHSDVMLLLNAVDQCDDSSSCELMGTLIQEGELELMLANEVDILTGLLFREGTLTPFLEVNQIRLTIIKFLDELLVIVNDPVAKLTDKSKTLPIGYSIFRLEALTDD